MTTFSRMRDREKRLGWAQPFPEDKAFVRRGTIGSYRDEMPPEILEYFEKISESALRATGYWRNEDLPPNSGTPVSEEVPARGDAA